MTLSLFPRSEPPVDPPGLRPYQERAIRLLRLHVTQGHTRILAVGPVGMGKMVLVAAISRTCTDPVLFVCHRLELIEQCVDQLARFGLTNVGVIRGADERINPDAAIQVASIQTLARRDKPRAGLIFVDEAHRSASDSYIDHVFAAYPDEIIIGLTATPGRLDGRPLGGNLYQAIEVLATYTELLKHPGWLATPLVYGSPPIDLSKVRTTMGDFDEGELGIVMSRLDGPVVEHWTKLSQGRRTLVFAVNIEHSMSLAARFERAGARVAHVDGKTPESQRRAALADLGAGRIDVVCNCNVLLEGVDVPSIKAIVHARPTQSITLWRQSVGRCMRPWNGVKPLVLDHAGNYDRLGCPFEDLIWSLDSRPVRRNNSPATKICKQCFAYVMAGVLLCPHCGYEFRPEDNARAVPEETSAELVIRNAEPDEQKRGFYVRQVITAKMRGFKPGYASAIYKQRYGGWPSRAWSDETKAEFALDVEWQKKNAVREHRKKMEQDGAPVTVLEAQLSDTLGAMDLDDEEIPF